MAVGRLTLRKRIFTAVLATGAIVLVIAAVRGYFWAAPRWRSTRPAVHEEAYAKAVTVAKEVFGSAAVDKGIVTIPKVPITLPYEGNAKILDSIEADVPWYALRLYVRVAPDASYLAYDSASEGCRAARISCEDARALWARFAYLDLIDTNITDPDDGVRWLTSDNAVFQDSTWGRPYVSSDPSWAGLVDMDYQGAKPEKLMVIRSMLLSHAIWDLLDSGEIPVSDRREELAQALRAVVESSFPPRSPADVDRLDGLMGEYESVEGRHAARLEEELTAYCSKRLPAWLFKVPLVGKRWRLADGLKTALQEHFYFPRHLEESHGYEGKSDEECYQIALAAALGPNQDAVRSYARYILFERWPEKWGRYIVENYGSLDGDIRNLYVPSREWPGELGEQLARLTLADTGNPGRGKAALHLFGMTHEPAYLEQILAFMREHSGLAAAPAVTDYEREIVRGLFAEYSRDRTSFDLPAAIRRFLGEVENPDAGIVVETLAQTGQARDDTWTPLLADVLNVPAKVFAANASFAAARREAASALGQAGTPAASAALTSYIENNAVADDSALTQAVAMALGDKRAVAALEALREPLALSVLPGSRDLLRLENRLSLLRLKTADDPVSYYAALPEAQRTPNPRIEDVADTLSKAQIQAILADDRCVSTRYRMCCSLLFKMQKETAERRAKKSGRE